MKRITLLLIAFLLVIFSYADNRAVFKIENANDLNKKRIPLSCEWDFYWSNFLSSDDIDNIKEGYTPVKVKIPSYWSSYSLDGQNFSGSGYGTYHLELILPHNFREPLGMHLPGVDVAYKLFVDGKLIKECGVIGKNKREEEPYYNPLIIKFVPESDTLKILVQVSNFNHRRGGIWKVPLISEYKYLERKENIDNILEMFTLGILFSFGIFYLIFSFYNRREKAIFFLALCFLFVFLRGICSNLIPISLISNIRWDWIIRLEYIGIFGGIICGVWGFYHILPIKFIKKTIIVLTLISVMTILGILTLPVNIFSYSMYIFYIVLSVSFLVFLIQTFKLLKIRRAISILYLSGFVMLLGGAFHDSFVSDSRVFLFDFYILPYVFLFFILTQSFEFFRRFVEMSEKDKQLSEELSVLNAELEEKVKSRTNQLNEKNKIIEKQNITLHKEVTLKNKIFAIIGHDLRSPLSNIIQGLDIFSDKSIPIETKETIAKKLGVTAYSLSMLVENLLSWGLSRNDQFKINLKTNNLSKCILQVINYFESTLANKDIKLINKSEEDFFAFFDEVSVMIIVRNLLANAVKFSSEGSEIIVTTQLVGDNEILIRVKDSGEGMSSDTIEKILKGEGIVSTPGTNNEKGTGLGLILCKELIELNNGEFFIESEPGKGSVFSFTLPGSSKISNEVYK